jgi:hypothetical protein
MVGAQLAYMRSSLIKYVMGKQLTKQYIFEADIISRGAWTALVLSSAKLHTTFPFTILWKMVVGRALRATGCPNCRVSIVRSFASLAGPTIRSFPPSPRPQYPTSFPKPRFSSNVPQDGHGNGIAHEHRGVQTESEEAKDAEELPEKDAESREVAAVPWYLQAESSQRAPQPLSERQRLPELPESPPTILEPILQRLSVDLGLDDLTLLDLRKLDPPPALGANLIMIFGTSRSERHLHVSADRFCRWLRSTYGLRPDADGLLGRNELKLKLRRKARRAKLLGSTADENEDDGVRSGWICVDVGAVESADPVVEESTPQNFVGFGRRTDGVTIVVQMLTEEKREEIDLEGLWGGILRRGLKQQNPEPEESDGDISNPSMMDAGSEEASSPSTSPIIGSLRGSSPSSIPSQRRGFHTSASRRLAQEEAQSMVQSSEIPEQIYATTASEGRTNLNDLRQHLMEHFAAGNFTITQEYFEPFAKDIPQLEKNGWRELLLQQLQRYVESIPREEASRLLNHQSAGNNALSVADHFSPMPRFPSETEVRVCLENMCYALEIGVPDYGVDVLVKRFREAQDMAVPIPAATFLRGIRCAMTTSSSENLGNGGRIDVALELLQAMHDQGHEVLTGQTFLTLQEGLARATPEGFAPLGDFSLPSRKMSPRQHRVHTAMTSSNMPLLQDETRIRILDLYSRYDLWAEFWEVWSMAPRRGQAQSAQMYAYMFRRIAEMGNQKASIEVLRTRLPEMDAEDPHVALDGEVADAVMALLRVADPYAEAEAGDPAARGEWVNIWRRVMQGTRG